MPTPAHIGLEYYTGGGNDNQQSDECCHLLWLHSKNEQHAKQAPLTNTWFGPKSWVFVVWAQGMIVN